MKNNNLYVKLLAVLGSFFLCISAFSATTNLKIVTEFMPPLQLAKSGHKMQGSSADFVSKVMTSTTLPFTTDVFPWARSYRIAQSEPNVVIFPLIRTQEREKDFHWIGKIWSFSAAIYKHSARQNITVASLEDAKNYNIAVYRNDFFHHYLIKEGFNEAKLFPASGIEQSIGLFINGRVDLIVIDSSIFEFYINQYNKKIAKFEKLISLDDVRHNDAYIAMSKQTSPSVVQQVKDSFNRVTQQ